MKLKTLKDFEQRLDNPYDIYLIKRKFVDIEELQVEVVKWIKEADRIAEDPEAPQDELRDFWMERLNISEEDLK